MKRLICLIFTIAGMTIAISSPARSIAASTAGTVTGVAAGSFPVRASFLGVNLTRFEIATGVITEPDGSANGVFHAVLAGRSLLGSVSNITLEGNVTQGSATPGLGSFSGLASLDLGNGLPAVQGVPFNVETRDGSMVLTIQSTVLPSAAFGQGGIDIAQ